VVNAAVNSVRPLIMGIVNVTPDSFSDGGRFLAASEAIAHGRRLIEEGADWLDIGGESTRPGANAVSIQEELDRVLPVIEGLADAETPLSIDTMKPAVARAAIAAGASLWNDVTGFKDPASLTAAGELKVSVAVMHMQGEPRTMQDDPQYADVVSEVGAFLKTQADALAQAGVSDIWVDPGIGFGKTLAHNLALIRAIPDLKAKTGRKLLFGASRKSLIAKIHPAAGPAGERIGGSLALALFAAQAGADMLRVHDVKATIEALAVAQAIS
jgi:dihydropteroate synthase